MPDYVNKVTLGSETLIDLTNDNITADDVVAKKSDGTTDVSFHLKSGATTTGNIVRRNENSASVMGGLVSVPAGYYSVPFIKAIGAGSATTPTTTITANPTISVDSSTGVITASVSSSKSITPTVLAGYISTGTAGTVTAEGSATDSSSIQAEISASDIKYNASMFGVTGNYTYEATNAATVNDIISSKVAYVNGQRLVGQYDISGSLQTTRDITANELHNALSGSVSVTSDTTPPKSGMQTVIIPQIKATENGSQRAVASTDIRAGVTILGQSGDSDVINTDSSGFVSGESAIIPNKVLSGYSGFVDGQKVSGTIDDNGSTGGDISTVSGTVTIPAGYTTGGTVQIASAEQAKIIASNIRHGVTLLGQDGGLIPCPNWVACSEYSWSHIYFNRNIDWGTILPLLDYIGHGDGFNVYFLGAAGNTLVSDYNIWALEFTNSNKYGIFTLDGNGNGISPVYATDAINETIVIDGTPYTFVANAGWNNISFTLPDVDPIYCAETVTYTGGSIDGSKMFAGDSVSFGNWKAYPTAGSTYTITQNGTYTFEQLSQYETIIVNVSGGGSTPPSVSSNVLQFNDNTTSVSGNTLNLGVSATVSDKTLQF